MINIVNFTRSDEEKVLNLWKKICIDEHGFYEWESYLNETHHEEYIVFFVVKDSDSDKVLGTIALSKIDDNAVELKRLYVDPDSRGKGVAKLLLETVMNYAKENSYKKVILETYVRFEIAVAFYRKNEFKEVNRINEKIFFEKEINY